MATIDIKKTDVKVRDGGTKVSGALNAPLVTETDGVSSGSIGDTTLTVTALSAAQNRMQAFTIEGDTQVYKLTADAAAGATSISFTPALKVAIGGLSDIVFQAGAFIGMTKLDVDTFIAADLAVGQIINVPNSDQDYIIRALDADPATLITIDPPLDVDVADDAVIDGIKAPNEITVTIGTGNLTFSESRNIEYVLDRGRLDTVKEGDEVPVDVSLSATWDFLRSGNGDTAPTLEEAIKQLGLAQNWTSTAADACEPYACDIVVEYNPGCGDEGKSEVIVLSDFRWETLEHDLSAGTISISGKCNITQALIARDIL